MSELEKDTPVICAYNVAGNIERETGRVVQVDQENERVLVRLLDGTEQWFVFEEVDHE